MRIIQVNNSDDKRGTFIIIIIDTVLITDVIPLSLLIYDLFIVNAIIISSSSSSFSSLFSLLLL